MITQLRQFTVLAISLTLATMIGPEVLGQSTSNQDAQVVEATMVDGVQVVDVQVGKMGYTPAKIVLRADVPARIVFTREQEGGCTHQVQVPAFGVEPTDLPVGEPVAVEFTPTDDGSYTFACSMEMVKGTFVVKG